MKLSTIAKIRSTQRTLAGTPVTRKTGTGAQTCQGCGHTIKAGLPMLEVHTRKYVHAKMNGCLHAA